MWLSKDIMKKNAFLFPAVSVCITQPSLFTPERLTVTLGLERSSFYQKWSNDPFSLAPRYNVR